MAFEEVYYDEILKDECGVFWYWPHVTIDINVFYIALTISLKH
jgi:hypothetical protein